MVTDTKAIDTLLGDAVFWDELGEEVKAIMEPVFRGIMEAGAEVGIEEVEELRKKKAKQLAGPTLLQQTLINETLPFFNNEWWAGLSQNTRAGLRKAIDKNIAQAASVQALKKDIVPLFGEARASAIAVTETTRLYAKGANASYRALGVNAVVWETAMDSAVEADCEALEGKVFPIDEAPQPPLHVRCRCGLGAAEVAEGGGIERRYRDVQAEESNAHAYFSTRMSTWRGQAHKPGNPYRKLSRQNIDDLDWYKGAGHAHINEFLRTGESISPLIKQEAVRAVTAIDEAMGLVVVPEDMVLWRAVRDAEGLLAQIKKGNMVGANIMDEGFMSTTFNRDFTLKWIHDPSTSVVFELKVPQGTRAIYMESATANIEGEVLLPRGMNWRVVEQRVEKRPLTPGGRERDYHILTLEAA